MKDLFPFIGAEILRNKRKLYLSKGWNKVLLKLPISKFTIPEVRLTKWMFTTVFVTQSGEKAVDGLVYSPDKK